MRKLAFLQKEPLSRLGVAFLLTVGIALPLLIALGLSANAPLGLLLALLLLIALTVLNATVRSRRVLWVLAGAFAAVQLFLPGMGLLGSWVEAFKALALYFGGYTVALPLFGGAVASLIAVAAGVLSYVFAKRGVGFLPAALVVVLVMFGLWSLGKGHLFWYMAPALVALLLQMSQAAHEKINVLHVLPMALAAVLLAFLLLPGQRLTLEPLSSAASALKQTINDYLFFTKPRNVFTLGTYGFYPMGGNQLGGEAEPSEFPVMMVKTDQKTLLRAVVKDNYTGRSFTDTSSAKRYLYVNPRWQAQRQAMFLELLPSEAIRRASHLLDEKAVSIQIQNRTASTVFTPLYLRRLNMTGSMVPYFNDSSELFITRDMEQGDRYTVYAPLLEGGSSGLEALVDASLKGKDNYPAILAAYTQLPDHLEKKVYDDVQNIVRNETTPYGKAMAIMRHLQKYYRYTLSPDTPPQNKDFVTYFLYVGKEGYCTYYAAAMTVMCRMAGLPSRYVEGFLAIPAADGFAYVTGKDAHAWTEVYFEGFGWIPFDATPNQESNNNGTPPQGEQEPEPSPEPDDQPTPTPDPSVQPDQPSPEPEPSSEPQDQPNEPDPEPQQNPMDFPWLLLVAVLIAAGVGIRIILRTPDRVAARMAVEKDKVFVYGASVQRLLKYAKRTPGNGETPLAFARRVDSVRVFSTPIAPLWRMLALSNYSRMTPTAEHTQRAAEIFHKVFKSSHPLRKARFLLGAAFDPHFYRSLDTPAPHDAPPKNSLLQNVKPKNATAKRAGAKGKTGKHPPNAAKTGASATNPRAAAPGRKAQTRGRLKRATSARRSAARPDARADATRKPARKK